MNIMQATFLVLRSVPTLDDDVLSQAHEVFCSLNAQHFDEISSEKVIMGSTHLSKFRLCHAIGECSVN